MNQPFSTVTETNCNKKLLEERIVHFGLGAFHRGHQAFILHLINQQNSDDQWGICAINLFQDKANIAEKLTDQKYQYSVIERSSDEDNVTIVKSIINTMVLESDGIDAVIEKVAEPQVEILTFTVTEKGYYTLPGGRLLDFDNVMIQQDILDLDNPKTLPGVLYKALRYRHDKGCQPITLLSCDNMPENGHVLKRALLGFIEKVDPSFAEYVENNITFPSSMVDRIVPAVTPESLDIAEKILGYKDLCTILTEPFIQWVIEDDFKGKRPNFDKIHGVSVVDNVIPFEEMKLRMLNGSHSFLAYLGSVAGYTYISDCMADPFFKEAAYLLMINEQARTLTVQNIDLKKYARELIKRFENSSLKHQTAQIAMDGSQKIPQRWLAPLLINEKESAQHPLLTLALAGWMHYVKNNIDELHDPLQKQIKEAVFQQQDNRLYVEALLSLESIFPSDFIRNMSFVNELIDAYNLITEKGVKKSVEITVRQIKGE